MGHKILTSPIDGIRSHFRTSYSLTMTLLETKNLEECKQLIEKGFGSFLMQKRMEERRRREDMDTSAEQDVSNSKKRTNSEADIMEYRLVLQKYGLKVARDYLKLERRLEKEKRNGEFLHRKLTETANELVNAIADYMPMGIGLKLKNGDYGYFLGDVNWGISRYDGFGVITHKGEFVVVDKSHIASFAQPENCLAVGQAQLLLDVLGSAKGWRDLTIDDCKEKAMIADPNPAQNEFYVNNAQVKEIVSVITSTPSFPEPDVPGSLVKHEAIIIDLQQRLSESPVVLANEGEIVVDALRYVAALKDPMAFINDNGNGEANRDQKSDTVYAWKMFQAVLKMLIEFGALEEEHIDVSLIQPQKKENMEETSLQIMATPIPGGVINATDIDMNGQVKRLRSTELGQLVGSLSADNELWLAMILSQPEVSQLTPSQLAAVVCACVVDGFKAQNAYFRRPADEVVIDAIALLEPKGATLRAAQLELGIEYPINLSVEAGGMVQSWAEGCSWRDIIKDTSLEQGDICRILRRTVEALKQIPNAYGTPVGLAEIAMTAANGMDRFPLTDDVSGNSGSTTSAAGTSGPGQPSAVETTDSSSSSSGSNGVGFGSNEGDINVSDGEADWGGLSGSTRRKMKKRRSLEDEADSMIRGATPNPPKYRKPKTRQEIHDTSIEKNMKDAMEQEDRNSNFSFSEYLSELDANDDISLEDRVDFDMDKFEAMQLNSILGGEDEYEYGEEEEEEEENDEKEEEESANE